MVRVYGHAQRLRCALHLSLLFTMGACAGSVPPPNLPGTRVDVARAQLKLEDRLRRLEGKLQGMDAQLAVLHETVREATRAAQAASLAQGAPRALARERPKYDGDPAELTWPPGQRIVTDAAGRVRLVAAHLADKAVYGSASCAAPAPLLAKQPVARARPGRSPRPARATPE